MSAIQLTFFASKAFPTRWNSAWLEILRPMKNFLIRFHEWVFRSVVIVVTNSLAILCLRFAHPSFSVWSCGNFSSGRSDFTTLQASCRVSSLLRSKQRSLLKFERVTALSETFSRWWKSSSLWFSIVFEDDFDLRNLYPTFSNEKKRNQSMNKKPLPFFFHAQVLKKGDVVSQDSTFHRFLRDLPQKRHNVLLHFLFEDTT